MSEGSNQAIEPVEDGTRKKSHSTTAVRNFMMLIKIMIFSASLTIALGYFSHQHYGDCGNYHSRSQRKPYLPAPPEDGHR